MATIAVQLMLLIWVLAAADFLVTGEDGPEDSRIRAGEGVADPLAEAATLMMFYQVVGGDGWLCGSSKGKSFGIT
jgi:hypothetical protein